ncbi:MAG: hypothetical protein MUF18_16880 [Fimbriiglobus sp.]|nr:hypothetical protein [Fimbriiglobus sp.]
MNDRVRVGTTYADGWFILCLLLGVAGLVGGGVVAFRRGDAVLAAVIGGFGLILLTLATARGVWIAANRKWIEDTDPGFLLTANGQKHEFDDDEVLELATKVTTRFSNGWPKANVRTGTLRLNSPAFPKPVAFRYEWPLSREDPLFDLFDRLLVRLARRAEKELAQNGEVAGEGWALLRDGLEYPGPEGPEVLPFEEVAAAEAIDGRVCVWAKGVPRPAFQVSLDSPNAPVLLQVLAKRLADRPTDPATDDPETLGRVIFERDISHTKAALVLGGLVAFMLFALGGASLYFAATKPGMSLAPWVIGGGLHLGAVALAVHLWWGQQNILRCHARGVCRVRNGKTTEMRYDEVKVFTYSAVRMYYNGAYTGTAVVLTFEDADGRKMQYKATIRNADEALDTLRDRVSRTIAEAMKRKLDAGKRVYWTDRVTFEPDGIAIAGKRGLFGQSNDVFVEWADVSNVVLQQGNFALFAHGRKKAVYDTTIATPNFFPGFHLILLVRFPPRTAEE